MSILCKQVIIIIIEVVIMLTTVYGIVGTFKGENFHGSIRSDQFAEKTFAKTYHT